MKVSEKVLEKRLTSRVEGLGGWSIKLLSGMLSGLPDRLCLLPGGRLFFAEIKTTGEKPRKLQKLVCRRIEKLGFKMFVIDSYESLEKAVKEGQC